MITHPPEEFFKTPEAIVVLNIVDILNRFLNMIGEYLIDVETSIIGKQSKKVIITKKDVLTNEAGKVIRFDNFLNYTGDIIINGKETIHLNKQRNNDYYKLQSLTTVAADILIAFIRNDIVKKSNWEAIYDPDDDIHPFIKSNYDPATVCDYIYERIDPFILDISEIYFNKDWNIHTLEHDGVRLTIKRYGDWRAFKWNLEQYEQQIRESNQE